MKVHITYSVQTKTNHSDFFLFISFKMQYSEEKKAPLDRVSRKVKKKIFFFRVGPKNRVGRDMGNRYNQLDVP